MKHRQNLTIFCLISLTISILIFLHTQVLERLGWSIFGNNLKWISYKQQQMAKKESETCTPKSKVFFKLQDLSEIDDRWYKKNILHIILNQKFRLLLNGDHRSYAFLLETNNKSSLTVRQGCAVESCVRFSGRSCLLLMLSSSLNICDKKVIFYLRLFVVSTSIKRLGGS